jgi:hypothetical protein
MLPLLCGLILVLVSQEPAKPLPDAETFRGSLPGIIRILDQALVREALHADFLPEAAEYTYTEKQTVITESSNRAGEKTQTNVYDMIRGPAFWQYYRKQVSRDGNPMTDQENKEQDRRHQTFEDTVRASLSTRDSQPEGKKQEDAKAAGDAQALRNDLGAMFDIRVAGRDRIDDLSVVLLELKANSKYKPRTDAAKRWQHLSMRVWITEDLEAVRLVAELGDPFDMGFGFIEKGATMSVERRQMIDDKVWLPVRTEVTSRQDRPDGKTLTPRQHVVTEFSNFKKFRVDILIRPAERFQ